MATSNFVSDLLDLDGYIPKSDGKWPSLKMVFDNLRCYPILAIFGVAMRFLNNAPDPYSAFSFWFLLPIFILLFMATIAQTAVLLAVLCIGIMSIYLQPSEKAAAVLANHEKWFKPLTTAFVVALGIICVISSAKLLHAITKILPGT